MGPITQEDRTHSRELHGLVSSTEGTATRDRKRKNTHSANPMSHILASTTRALHSREKHGTSHQVLKTTGSFAMSGPYRSRSPPNHQSRKRQRISKVGSTQRDHVSESSEEDVIEVESRSVEAVRPRTSALGATMAQFEDKSGPGPSSITNREKSRQNKTENPPWDMQPGVAETNDPEDADPMALFPLDRTSAPIDALTSTRPFKSRETRRQEMGNDLQCSDLRFGGKPSKPPLSSLITPSSPDVGNGTLGQPLVNAVPAKLNPTPRDAFNVDDGSTQLEEFAVDRASPDAPPEGVGPAALTKPSVPRLDFSKWPKGGLSAPLSALKNGKKAGNVVKRVKEIENMYGPPSGQPTPIPIPGRTPLPAQGFIQRVSSGMKGKQSAAPSQSIAIGGRLAVAAGPSRLTNTPRQRRSLPEKALPIKAWYIGEVECPPLAQKDAWAFYVQWTDGDVSICARERDPEWLPEFGQGLCAKFGHGCIREIEASPRTAVDPVVVTLTVATDQLKSLNPDVTENDKLVIWFQTASPDWTSNDWGKLLGTLEYKSRSHSRGGRPEHALHHFSTLGTRAQESVLELAQRAATRPYILKSPKLALRSEIDDEVEEEEISKPPSADPTRRSLRSKLKAPSTIDDHDGIISFLPSDANTARRSKRQAAQAVETLGLSINDTEFLFSYPPLNITRGELNRLEPDEFLNDTLIEFGLKIWTNDLMKSDPALADNIWVFNSFFYKKLSGKKNPEDAYHSVQKWTAKVDIFQKRFIVVPINENLHWYLAVIYRPDYCLIPRETVVRTSARKSAAKLPQHYAPVSPTTTDVAEQKEVEADLDVPDTDLDHVQPLTNAPDFSDSTSPSTPTSRPSDDQLGDIQMLDIVVDDDDDDIVMDVDQQVVDSDIDQLMADTQLGERVDDGEPNATIPGIIPPFEREDDRGMPATASPPPLTVNTEAQSDPTARHADVRSDDADDFNASHSDIPPPSSKSPTTFVFMLDSLGGQHPKAANALKNWLKLEAKNKKGIEISDPISKKVPVPFQPNHVDCGVYLLHFADVVVRKADEIQRLVEGRGLKDAAARSQVFEGEMLKKKRAAFKQRTVELMKAWAAEHPPDPSSKVNPSNAKLSTSDDDNQSTLELKRLEHENAPRRPPIVRPTNGPTNSAVPGDSANPVVIGQDDEPDVPLATEQSENTSREPSAPAILPQQAPADESDDEIEFIGETRRTETPQKSKGRKNVGRKGKEAALRIR